MRLPAARGPLSRLVFPGLASAEAFEVDRSLAVLAAAGPPSDAMRDADLQITLWALYELHYRGFEDVPDEREWDPDVLMLRREVERIFGVALREAVKVDSASPATRDGSATRNGSATRANDFADELRSVIESYDEGPSLAAYLHREADREQVLEFLRQRSLYHLKESDPHAFVVPRVEGPAKVALAELQYDEYGSGRAEALHSKLFADALVGAGLNSTYGAYVDQTPASTLAVNNLMSFFGLQRRWRGAALGHLAAFETTSSVPCRKIAAGIERVGLPTVVSAYFHEHVEADAVHEQVALRDICGRLVAEEPALAEDVLFGALACLALDAVAATDLVNRWSNGEPATSLEAAS